MPPHPLTNSKIQKYYQNEPKVSGVYSRNNLPKIKDGAYGINTDEFKSMGTNWIALYVNTENVAYFGNLGVEHIPKKKNRKFIGNKNSNTNIYKIQAYDSLMCEYFCIGFIDFVVKGKSLLEYTNLFSPAEYKKNDETLSKYFQ